MSPHQFYERTSALITTNPSFSEWTTFLRDANISASVLDRPTHRCQILETGNDSYRFKASSEIAKKETERIANIDNILTNKALRSGRQISVIISDHS